MVLCGKYASKAVKTDAVVSLAVVLGELMRQNRTIKIGPNRNVGSKEQNTVCMYKGYVQKVLYVQGVLESLCRLNRIASWCLNALDHVTGDHCYVGDGVKNKVCGLCIKKRLTLGLLHGFCHRNKDQGLKVDVLKSSSYSIQVWSG